MKRPRPLPSRNNFQEFIYSMFNGFEPKIIDESVTGHITSRSLKIKVTRKIKELVDNYPNCKIGATGDPRIRSGYPDYRSKYSRMFLVYKSKSFNYVADIECHYIKKFLGRTDNISVNKAIKLSSYDGYYYLYVVTN